MKELNFDEEHGDDFLVGTDDDFTREDVDHFMNESFYFPPSEGVDDEFEPELEGNFDEYPVLS